MEKKIWIVSDTHFGHDREFIWSPRGFESIWEHDEKIIKNWNSKVSAEDTVYHLGDVMLGNNEYGLSCLKQLKGNIHIIRGNHDTESRLAAYRNCWNVVEVCDAKYLKYKKYHFYLSHFPTITSNYDQDKSLKRRLINLCGHSHTRDRFEDLGKGLIYHCELDAHICCPITIDKIIEDFKAVID